MKGFNTLLMNFRDANDEELYDLDGDIIEGDE